MKNFKKITTMAAALLIAASLSVPMTALATADPEPATYTIQVDANSESTYKVYQLLTGKFEAASGTELVLVGATAGTNLAEGQTPANVETALASATKDTDVTALIKGEPVATLDKTNTSVDNLAEGYYAIIETNTKKATILQIVSDSTTNSNVLNITSKLGSVQFEKKLKDINDSTETEMSDWQDGADHDVGDAVPFQLKATLPENVSSYEGYYLQFRDTIDSAFNVDELTDITITGVKINTTDIAKNTVAGANTGYDITVTENSIKVTFPDIKHIADNANIDPDNAVITFEYTAVLGNTETAGKTGDNVKYGTAGNPNTAYAVYSTNADYDMYPNVTPGNDVPDTPDNPSEVDKPQTPGTPDSPGKEETNTSSTPEDKVRVFTYITEITKQDQDGANLAGADFTLSKFDAKTGNYVPVAVKIGQTAEGESTDSASIRVKFSFYGLDDGQYKLEETETPEGYNGISPITFTVTAEHQIIADDPQLTSLTAEGFEASATTGDIDTGKISASVKNTKGNKLPTTGGVGTKMFYAIGGSLTGLAGVALITKKRMSKKSK